MDDLTPEPHPPVDLSWVTTEAVPPKPGWAFYVLMPIAGVAFGAVFTAFGWLIASAAGWCS